MKEKLKNLFSSKSSTGGRRGALAASTVIIVVLIVIFANLILGQLPSNVTQFDISSTKIYSISDETKQYLANLKDEIEIILVVDADNVDERIAKFARKYAALSDKITLSEVDPVVYPSILTQYECASANVVVRNVATGKFKAIPYKAYNNAIVLYTLNYDYKAQDYVTDEITFDGEGQLTSAIDYVINDFNGTVYALGGHGEGDIPTGTKGLIDKANLKIVDDYDLLLNGGIPSDCDMLLCFNPTEDLADDELEMIKNYVAGGGDVMLFVGTADLDNFNKLTEYYGLAVRPGYVGDTSRYFSNYAQTYSYYCFSPVLSKSNEITRKIDTNAMILYPLGMELVDAGNENITVDPFLSTSANGFRTTDGKQNISGTYVLAATATDGSSSGTMTVYSCVLLVSENVTAYFPNMSNNTIIMNNINLYFDGASDISIPSKSLQITYNTINSARLWAAVFIIVLPVLILAVGFVNWLRRRKK